MTANPDSEPTSTKLLRAEIERFLATDAPEVLSIRGKWGAGKTYAWNSFLMKAKDTEKIALKSYAYVSLFGIQSLDELKYAVFENTVNAKDIGFEPTIEGLKENAAAVLKRAGKHSIAGMLSYFKNVADAVKMVSFLSVTRQIICIDDIERKGKSLRTQDVLGLVSLLRERRKCKVVLILNDDELEEDDKKQLAKFQEKVIDSSLLFAPTAKDCAEIALPKATGPLAHLAKHCVALGLSNIRVIKKIERLVVQVEPLLTNYNSAILEQAIQTLTLFGWAHFGRTSDSDVSLLSYILKHHGNQWFGPPDPDKLSDEEKKWAALLDSYSFTNVDDLDLVLLDAVRNGFIDVERLQHDAEILDEKHKAAQSDKALNEAWRRIHDSFDDNEDEALDGLVTAYTENIQVVTPGNLEALMVLLKDLGHDDLAREGLTFFMQERKEEDRNFYDIENHPFRSQSPDPDMKKAFDERLATFKIDVVPADILKRIGEHQAWSSSDIAALSALSAADYKSLFKTLRGPAMRTAVRAALGFERISNRGGEYDSIINNARQALEEIAAESPLNKRRVRYLIGAPPAERQNVPNAGVNRDEG
ncbi:hypothetical protein C7212DRAFT_349017 [Tuber magnatum]|uniref:KAP NTPase domain-containing protein n=1 Tax=Tuber magnatum TaxID=42249 RepID=A0A317SBE8_9PEZI|nr:hypothetical protein C7212DRAFT_349017 [Tuber magnatum]